MRSLIACSLAVALFSAAIAEAAAQSAPAPAESADAPLRAGPGRQALMACRADMRALCGGVEAGGGRKFQCLAQNRDKLSGGCRNAIQTVLAKGGVAPAPAGPPANTAPQPEVTGAAPTARPGIKMQQICRADIASICGGIEKGQGRIARCLNDNAAKISPPCQAALVQRKAERRMLRRDLGSACAADRQSVCGPGIDGPALVECLRQAEAKLSPECKESLARPN